MPKFTRRAMLQSLALIPAALCTVRERPPLPEGFSYAEDHEFTVTHHYSEHHWEDEDGNIHHEIDDNGECYSWIDEMLGRPVPESLQ